MVRNASSVRCCKLSSERSRLAEVGRDWLLSERSSTMSSSSSAPLAQPRVAEIGRESPRLPRARSSLAPWLLQPLLLAAVACTVAAPCNGAPRACNGWPCACNGGPCLRTLLVHMFVLPGVCDMYRCV